MSHYVLWGLLAIAFALGFFFGYVVSGVIFYYSDAIYNAVKPWRKR